MKERPILMSAPMVRACLDGTKTQTRRALRPQPHEKLADTVHYDRATGGAMWASFHGDHGVACPYGVPGERLWVRETWRPTGVSAGKWTSVLYRADEAHVDCPYFFPSLARRGWRPAIHMPRAACRLVLEVTGVRVERLHDISNDDAQAEGVHGTDWGRGLDYGGKANYVPVYQQLWDSLNAKRGLGWAVNPWVWVIEFSCAAQMKEAA